MQYINALKKILRGIVRDDINEIIKGCEEIIELCPSVSVDKNEQEYAEYFLDAIEKGES